MTHDDIIRMAREADLEFVTDAIEFFADLVAAAEREACAKVCDAYDVAEDVNSSDTAEGIAIAIRARGQHD
jgi:hypothetical protein